MWAVATTFQRKGVMSYPEKLTGGLSGLARALRAPVRMSFFYPASEVYAHPLSAAIGGPTPPRLAQARGNGAALIIFMFQGN